MLQATAGHESVREREQLLNGWQCNVGDRRGDGVEEHNSVHAATGQNAAGGVHIADEDSFAFVR